MSSHGVTTTATPRLIGVQYLRALGALMIVHFHATIQIPAYTTYFEKYLLGGAHLANGVDLFFVISGFIMLVSSQRARPSEFLIRRVIRIVPLYWALTLLLVLIALWRPELFRTTIVKGEYLAKSLLFIPYANPGQNGVLVPLLVPGWSLNFEMFFYLLFSVSLLAPLRLRLSLTGPVFAALLTSKYLLRSVGYPSEFGFLADLRLFEFWLGMAIAQLFIDKSLRLPAPVGWLLVGGGFIALLWGFPMLPLPPNSLWRFVLDSIIPSAAVVLGMVSLDQRAKVPHVRLLAFLGDASYSIYLSHIFSLGVARFAWAKLGLEPGSALYATLFAAVSVAAAVAGAAIVYCYLESPMLHALQGWSRRLFVRRAVAIPVIQRT